MDQRDKDESLLAQREARKENVRRAFDLAYFIHADIGIALRVTEAALCKLEHTFGRQSRRYHYAPGGRRQSQAGPAYTTRTKVSLREEHLLQLLVYAESEAWERCTEYGNGPYPLREEDMVIRFIKHLVQITLKRNSFYIALGIGRLLYEYDTSQARQMYDILMQDQTRFRDNSYLRKQKKVLMREVIERFDHMIRIAKTPQREYRFVTQPITQSLIRLVHECLHHCTPWETTCVVPVSFDPTERIPALAFSGSDPDKESPIEINRIHTILDPDCFSRLVTGLGFESPERRLAVPQFFLTDTKEPRGDRFKPPPLTSEDEIQLERARESGARRRKAYLVGQLRIYIDDIESAAFDPRRVARVAFTCRPGANVIEVRGGGAEGDLPLATLLVSYEDIPSGGSLVDSVVLEGGQKLTIVLTPIRNASGVTKEVSVELRYKETQPLRAISWLAQRAWLRLLEIARGPSEGPQELKPGYSWPAKVGLAVALSLTGVVIIAIMWRQLRPAPPDFPVQVQVSIPPAPTIESTPPGAPSQTPPVVPQTPRTPSALIAQATWDKDPTAVAHAIRIGARRGDVPNVEIPITRATLHIALNRADAGDRMYHRYRIILVAGEEPIWQRILQAPQVRSSSRAHVLSLEFSPQRFPNADSYRLRVEGETQAGWQSLGQVQLVGAFTKE